MKKIVLTLVVLFFSLSISTYINAQDSRCKGWQDDLDAAEKKAAALKLTKEALQEFINMMEDPESGLHSIKEEIASTESEMNELQKKINEGDKSPESALELKALRSRVSLLKLRASNKVDEKEIFKNPEYKMHEKNLNNLKLSETEARGNAEAIIAEMKANKCPITTMKKTDDITEIDFGWSGNWKYTHPENPEFNIVLVLFGSGPSVTGNLNFEGAKYSITGCKEAGLNKLRCDFTAALEDEEKFADLKGNVDLHVSGNTLNTVWTEIGSPAVRWKPGKVERQVVKTEPKSTPFTFKKE